MADFAHAVVWMVISPIAVLTDVLAIIIIAHYYPFFHGTDIMMTSLLSAMTLNALLVLPIPAFLELKGMAWNPSLCLGYVWCFITFRLAQIMSLCGMSIHWSAILKVSAERKNYFSTKYLKFGTVLIWTFSAIAGSLPLIGAANSDFNTANQCKFLAFNLGTGFPIFFLVCIIAAFFVGMVCSLDTTFLIRQMKRVAEIKYRAGRFHVPDRNSGVPTQGTCSISERYHRLNFAWDLSCFVLLVIVLSFLGNHFPYAVMQGIQLFHQVDRNTLETITLWLVGLESLLLPHTLLFFSRRYRHAITYVWQVYLLRRKDVEEENAASCMLQSYTKKDKDRLSIIPSRPQSTIDQNGGVSASGTLRSTRSDINPNKDYVHTNGRPTISTITDTATDISVSDVPPQNGIIQGEVFVEKQPYNERGVDTTVGVIETLKVARRSKTPERKETEIKKRTYEQESANTVIKDTNGAYKHGVQRSSSTSSRKEFREKMRKKHLPPIFVNEAFDAEDHGSLSVRREEARRALYSASGDSELSTSLHYYMSSDYHPDYLTESLPRHKLRISTESDSTGVNEPYNDNDISDVLDRSFERSSLRRSDKTKRDIDLVNIKPMPIIERPYLRTFVSPTSFEKDDIAESESGSDSSHFKSSLRGLREDREIIFDSETIPLDDINDGFSKPYNKGKPVVRTDIIRPFQTGARDTKGSMPKVHNVAYLEQTRFQTRSPIYDNLGVVETSTSFSRQNNETNSVQNSLASTGSFSVSHINSSQSDTESFTLTPRTSKTSASDSVNNGDDEMNDSSGSNSSVTLSPYKEEMRRRPWMENLDYNENDVLAMQMQEPLVHADSDTDTLKASQDSFDRLKLSSDNRESGASTPMSLIFDEETERGFEEALDYHINPTMSGYSGIGLCFESIKEEPEDLTSSGSNPFLDEISNEQFKTRAVISKQSDSGDSRPSSADISETVFPDSPSKSSRNNRVDSANKTPTILTTDADRLFDDSGFTSAMDHVNTSDSSNQQEVHVSGKLSPWLDSDDNIRDVDLSFESDFSHSSVEKFVSCNTQAMREKRTLCDIPTKSAKSSNIMSDSRPKPVKPVKPFQSPTVGIKLKNMSVQEIKATERRVPIRAKSFDENSPGKTKRSPVVRSGSLDEPKTKIRPAYF